MRYSLLALFAIVSSVWASDLPRSAYPVLLKELHADKVLGLYETRRRTIGSFDYLGVKGFEVSSGGKSVYYSQIVLRKHHSDAHWSKAALFSCRDDLEPAFRLHDSQFLSTLRLWPPET